MTMDVPRNMTGLYLGGFIQEGYLPPRERKSTIPSTLYRGHVVKLARAPNSNPHRSSVGRYPMHSLNSGFAGLKVPIKDQMNYKNPEEQLRAPWRPKTRGKWANYPMTIEVRKMAGNGLSASYLAECVLGGSTAASIGSKQNPLESGLTRAGNLGACSRVSYSPVQYRDNEEDQFYQTMFEEIRQVVSVQDDAMKRNREKLERILINDSNISIRPDVVSPARGQKRVATSYGHVRRGFVPSQMTKRPHTTLPANDPMRSSLLLPVPFVSHHRPQTKEHQSVMRSENVTPWLPNVVVTSPRMHKAKAERNYRDDGVRWNTPEPMTSGTHSHSNIGMTSFERLQKLLDAAAQEDVDSPRRDRFPAGTVRDIAARKPPFENNNERLDASLNSEPTQQAALSVVVPAYYQEEQSLPPTPLPPTPLPPSPDPHIDMGSAASKLTRKTSDHTPSPPPSEVSIKLMVERDDGKRVPVNFDMDVETKHNESAITNILDEVESQAVKKRRELEQLLLEHQQIVHEIVRLETTTQ